MKRRGFTLIELLVVVALIAILAAVSAPMISRSVDQSRESALRENLRVMRKAIDDYYGDTGHYPPSLETLVERRYVRAVPKDPVNEEGPWDVVWTQERDGITDLHSQSTATAADGTTYAEW